MTMPARLGWKKREETVDANPFVNPVRKTAEEIGKIVIPTPLLMPAKREMMAELRREDQHVEVRTVLVWTTSS